MRWSTALIGEIDCDTVCAHRVCAWAVLILLMGKRLLRSRHHVAPFDERSGRDPEATNRPSAQ